ncbi:MAG: DUF4139 domain-containing protein [Deltaproteobacteria bacterium]|nr:DUF4139 domain-containing protein [Deltaproteobacteria bacterium]
MSTTSVVSTIEAVTVYRRGALVRRATELPVPRNESGGAWEIKLGGLPLCLDDGSVRARVEPAQERGDEADDELPIARDLRVILDVGEPDDSLPPAEDDALKLARKQERRLTQTLRQVEGQIEQLDGLTLEPRPASRKGEPPQPSPTKARLALVALRERRERRLWEEHHALGRELEQVQRRRAELEDRERRGSSARQPIADELRKAIVVRLEGGTGAARLSIEYLVPGARWAPAYSVRLGTDTKEARLAMRALVAQRSGEDWDGVALTLSTAEPQAWTELPKLTSIRIGRRQTPSSAAGWRPVPPGAEELFADFDRCFRDELPAAGPGPARGPARPPSDPWDQDEDGVERQLREETAAAEGEVDDVGTLCALADDLTAGEEAFDGPAAFGSPMAKMEKGRARMALARPAAPPPGPPGPPGGTVSSSAPVPEAAPGAAAPEWQTVGTLDQAAGSDLLPLAVEDQLLDYGRLRLAPPRSTDRGKLTLVTQQALYLELLVQQRVEVHFDMPVTLAWAKSLARHAGDHGLSSRHQLAWSDSHDYAYPAEDPADVPSDGEYHSLPIRQGASEASLSYVVVPRESTDVFRVAELPNPFDAPLLSGPVDVYRDGDFLISSDLAFTPARATIELGMGVEQAVKVSRNTRFQERSVGLIGGSSALEHKIQIEALNHLDRAVDLEVRERVPVISEDQEDIKIEIGEVSPDWESYEPFPTEAAAEPLEGGHRWNIVLAPGEKKAVWAEYEVRIPSKYELVGGNRREA